MGAAVRAWRSYRGLPLRLRWFLLARFAVLPRRALARELRQLHGRVLSVGAGHGLIERWLAELDPGTEVDGLELDAERVELAERAAHPRVQIRRQDVRELDEPASYDAALAIDLIHHVPTAAHQALAEALAQAVKPGGVLLVKDIARTPGWKRHWNSFHDHVVAGEWTVDAREPEDLAAVFERAGFAVERCYRAGRLSPYAHFMLRLRRA